MKSAASAGNQLWTAVTFAADFVAGLEGGGLVYEGFFLADVVLDFFGAD